jgi:hypothetical protein
LEAKRTIAVHQYRKLSRSSPDFFPTPPWATRALFKYAIGEDWRNYSAWEPACGNGAMSGPIGEFFGRVRISDLNDHGAGGETGVDFLLAGGGAADKDADWIITNPPFTLAEAFALKALDLARTGVAIFVRATFLEGKSRWRNIFKDQRPLSVWQFVERVPLRYGRLERNAASAVPYVWIVWERALSHELHTRFEWIPPCRKELERDEDYPS